MLNTGNFHICSSCRYVTYKTELPSLYLSCSLQQREHNLFQFYSLCSQKKLCEILQHVFKQVMRSIHIMFYQTLKSPNLRPVLPRKQSISAIAVTVQTRKSTFYADFAPVKSWKLPDTGDPFSCLECRRSHLGWLP